jgi:DNA-binding XRE family transcriptional regulator
MAKNFKILRDKLPADARRRVAERVIVELEKVPLSQLRKARKLTQAHLAEKLGVDQAAVSRVESRGDLYLSTLREYVEAMGGQLEIRADFPNGGSFPISVNKPSTARR